MSDTTALDGFLDKWRARWPEWRVLEVFVPVPQRRLALAWFALLQEFADAMNIAGDPLPADAKLAWWGEELRDWQRQRSRHPLGRVLEPCRAPWFELAEALPALIGLRDRPASLEAASRSAGPLAEAIAAVEAALFQVPVTQPQVRAIASQLLAARVEEAGVAAVASGTRVEDWVAGLLAAWPPTRQGAAPRRLWSALARSRLQRGAAAGEGVAPLTPMRALWLGWRAASR